MVRKKNDNTSSLQALWEVGTPIRVKERRQDLPNIETPKELSELTAQIRTTSQSIEITIPVPSESKRLSLLIPSFVGWSVAGAIALFWFLPNLLGGNVSASVITLGIVLIGWAIGEGYGFRALVQHLFGKERLLFSQDDLRLGDLPFGRQKEQHIDLAKIYNLRLAPQHERNAGKLVFDYGKESVTCCRHVSDAEARTLLKTVSDILTFRCYAVERIVFGRHHIPDDNPVTTFHNPDVSELIVPFVHLHQIVIHTNTYDFHQVERFLTYAVNHIGQRYLKHHVTVDIYGNPEKLSPHMKNSLTNLCKHVTIHAHEKSI
jgi:hypothetical protein